MGKEGWLRVATGGAPFKSEKKRWVVLDGNTMTLYKEEAKKKEADKWGLLGAKVTEAKEKKKKYVQIELAGGKGTQYVAAGEGEHSPWFSALGAATAKRLTVDDFDLLNVIGKGSFGKVMQVQKKDTGKIYAMKVMHKKTIIKKNDEEHIKAERRILQKLVHPFLVNLHYSFQSPDKLYLIMDYVNGGELFFHMQQTDRFNEPRVRFYVAEISLGLEYLHSAGVIYRDLKPENILITAAGHICLTDFGISKEGLESDDARTATFCGTPEYLAPEVLQGLAYTKAVDWWSLGTLTYELLDGNPPFYAEDVQAMYQKILREPLVFHSSNFSEHAKSFIARLLDRNPETRLHKPDEVKAHPFFTGIDWEKLLNCEIEPPYKPPVKDAKSTALIDPEFTKEKARVSQTKTEADYAKHFDGFTFDADEEEG